MFSDTVVKLFTSNMKSEIKLEYYFHKKILLNLKQALKLLENHKVQPKVIFKFVFHNLWILVKKLWVTPQTEIFQFTIVNNFFRTSF